MPNDILYSFRRCPFAMRARWALLKTKKRVVLREVLLRNKPKELIDISPKSTVPVLHTSDGLVIDESINIIHWCLEKTDYLNFTTNPDDSFLKEIYNLINQNDYIFKYHLDRYKYPNRYQDLDHNYHMKSAYNIILEWNERLALSNNRWLVGHSETIADWALWPFVRQYRMVNKDKFDNNNQIKYLYKWLSSYTNDPLYDILMTKYEPWNNGQRVHYFP